MRRASFVALAVAAAGALAVSGCGDDDRPPVDAGPLADGEVPDGEVPDGEVPDGGTVPECWVPDTAGPTVTECPDAPPPLASGRCEVTAGDDGLLITGHVLTPGEVFRGGQVLVDASGTITCAGCDCSGEAGAGTATQIVCPGSVVSPGLINAHEHITFISGPAETTEERYEHRHDWREGIRGHTEISSGSRGSGAGIVWTELRHLLGGATAVNGSGRGEGLLRNLDVASGLEGLDQPDGDYDTFPLGDASGTLLDSGCDYGSSRTTAADIADEAAYTPHISEGIDDEARNEFVCQSMEGGEFDLIEPHTGVIHGIGMTASDIGTMAAEGSTLIWSARTNVSLYGDTARVPTYASMGVRIALGTDWLRSGSMNMLRELQCADELNAFYYNAYFTDEELWLMATRNAAGALAMDDAIGSIEPGLVADIAIFDASERSDHRAVIEADVEDVVLVLRAGDPLYGDGAVVDALSSTTCDTLDVCSVDKRVCTAGTGSSLSDIMAAGPSYELFYCGTPEGEPTCVPQRDAMDPLPDPVVDGSNRYTGEVTDLDGDGDGIEDDADNCPCTFNPIRPMDVGAQADFDGDGFGDECDPCPLDADTLDCTPPDPNDSDGDGVPNAEDNCPGTPNPDQADADEDGHGDVCDPCPDDANPGTSACPATIYEVKDGTLGAGTAVNISGAIVTAVGSNGFVMQVDPADADYDGAPYSGVFVFTGDAPTVSRGDRVDIPNGTVNAFMGQTQISYFDPVTVTESGVTLPAPVGVTAAEVADGGARAAELEGVLVELTDAEVTAVSGTDFTVESALPVDDFLFAVSPTPIVGEIVATLTGVLAHRSGQQLWPRDDADFVFGDPTLAALEPALSFAREGTTDSPTFPDPLTVRLTRAVATDTTVTITSDDPTGLGVMDVTVAAGSSTAVVPVDANTAMDAAYTVTAMLGTDNATADVRVLDGTEEPVPDAIMPSTATVPTETTFVFTVLLDIPAPSGGTTVMLSVDTGGSVPATVTVPVDAIEADFTFTAGSTAATATITATVDITSASATADVVEGSSAPVVINEVDYDQPGTDTDEFIELYNRSGATVDLSAYQVVLVNGSGGATYDTIDLSGTLDADGYLVIASSTVSVDAGATVINFSAADNNVQNGSPDGIVLWDSASGEIVDALSYEGSITGVTVDGVTGLSLVEGTAATAEDSGSTTGSLSRLPNGTDTDDADSDWAFTTTPTPGTANVM